MWGSKMLLQGQAKLLEEAAHHYAQEISPEALQYLEGRGISEEVAARYRLGSITDPIEGHQGYEGWISIPYFTALDICVGFKFRRLDDGKPKYGAPVGQKSHLFNVIATMSNTSRVVVCEGEFDAIVMEANCQVPAVGVPGVAAWKPYYSKLFNGFDMVYVVGDNDVKEDGTNPGAEFSRRVAGELINSQIVQLPPGMDITDFYLVNGQEATANLVGGVK
jgi:DNA primase